MKLYKMQHIETGEVKYYISKKKMCKDNKLTSRLVSYVITKQRNHHKDYKFYKLDVDNYNEFNIQDKPLKDEKFICDISQPLINKSTYIPNISSNIKSALLFGDVHFNLEHKPTIDIMKQILQDYTFDEIINGGDSVDFGELSFYDYFEDVEANFKLEKASYEKFMFELKKLQPQAKFVELYSNHFNDRAFRVSKSGDFKRYGMEDVAFKFFTDLNFPYDYRTESSLEIYYPFEQRRVGGIHGIKHNKHVANATGDALGGRDVFHFHTHTIQTYTHNNESPYNKASRFYSLPCCCNKDLKYRRNMTTRWVNGFAILNYIPETDYYTITNVIVENNQAIYNNKIYYYKK